jgi:glycosyltransferase involved in cell wall biosynthesis
MKVDIIMRTKDRPIFLERAIKDVMAQSYKNWFLCIINDGGKASEVDKLVKKYKSHAKQIKVIHHAKSKGMEAASNAGIKSTNGELIVIHDDDDTWHPDFLKKCVAKLQEPVDYADIGGVVTKVDKIYEKVKGDKIIKVGVGHFGYYKEQKSFLFINDIFSDRFKIWTMAFIFRRSCLDIVGLYDEKLPVLGDMDFNFRFIKNFDIAFIDETLAHYHRRPQLKGVAGNSINSGTIETYQNLVFNKYIREDFNKGKLNFGAAIMQARYFYRLNKDLMENRFYYKFKRFVKLIIKKLLFRG